MSLSEVRKAVSIRDSRGDTIVEVMVVLAVLGLAIGIAYATANRSLLNARQAQENSMATEVAQTQVEGMVAIGCSSGDASCDARNPLNPAFKLFQYGTAGTSFCMDNTNTPVTSGCAAQADALPPDSNPQVVITCLSRCASSPYTFNVQVSWDDVLGDGRDTVTQDYVLTR
jgi:prepilin-type N-terminal cleavage/methylation domain-containing protein